MAMAVDSAATITDVRASDAASPRTASNPSGPNSARAAGRVTAASAGDQGRRGQRHGHDRQQCGYVTGDRFAVDRPDARNGERNDRYEDRPDQIAAHVQSGMMLVRAAAHRLHRRNLHGLARGRERRKKRHRDAAENRRRHRRQAKRDRRRPAAHVERIHRLRDQTHRALGHHSAERDADHRACQSEQQRFTQEQPQNPAPPRAQRAQNADLRPPPHHAHRDRVVDEKRAHHQRNIAEHQQIPAKRAQHALVLVRCAYPVFRCDSPAAARRGSRARRVRNLPSAIRTRRSGRACRIRAARAGPSRCRAARILRPSASAIPDDAKRLRRRRCSVKVICPPSLRPALFASPLEMMTAESTSVGTGFPARSPRACATKSTP